MGNPEGSITSVVRHAPRVSAATAGRILQDRFGVTGLLRPLTSERDQNFLVTRGDAEEEWLVLKIANGAEDLTALQAQNEAMQRVADRAPSLGCPRVCPTTEGETVGSVDGGGGRGHFVRLLTYVEGRPLAEVRHGPELLWSLGEFLGRLDAALDGFSHPGARRALPWDPGRGQEVVASNLGYIVDRDRRAMVERLLRRFERSLFPALPELRRGVIHNDANDYNVLVSADVGGKGSRVTGLVDFGDMVETYTVCEVAVAAAYASMEKAEPLVAAAQVVAGFHRAFGVRPNEWDLLHDLIMLRLCTSVALAACQRTLDPQNAYLTISEAPAWDALCRLSPVRPIAARRALRSALTRARRHPPPRR